MINNNISRTKDLYCWVTDQGKCQQSRDQGAGVHSENVSSENTASRHSMQSHGIVSDSVTLVTELDSHYLCNNQQLRVRLSIDQQ